MSKNYIKKEIKGQVASFYSLAQFRVARWYIFKPKIPIRVNFRRSCNLRWCYTYFMAILSILLPNGILCGHLVRLWSCGTFFPVWYAARRKIWQPWPQFRVCRPWPTRVTFYNANHRYSEVRGPTVYNRLLRGSHRNLKTRRRMSCQIWTITHLKQGKFKDVQSRCSPR
jgi:hypothetical protein